MEKINRFHLQLLVIMLMISSLHSSAQKAMDDPFQLTCRISTRVKTSEDVFFTISLINKSRNVQFVFDSLDYGDNVNKFANLYIVLEKRGTKYKEYTNMTIFDLAPSYDTLTKPHKELAPGDSVIYRYHLDNIYQLEKGFYRLKCYYRKDLYADAKISSNWAFFTVINALPVKHDF